MKQTQLPVRTWLCGAFYLFLSSQILQAQQFIPIADTMVYDLSLSVDPHTLFDEQYQIGDPSQGSGIAPVSPFDNYGNSSNENTVFIIDLGGYYSISEMWFYDINAVDSLYICTGDLLTWGNEVGVSTTGYNTWRSLAINSTSRFIKLRFRTMGAKVGELAFYGSLVTPLSSTLPPPLVVPPKDMDEVIGTNGFIWSPDSLLEAIGSLREYRSWDWSDGGGDANYQGYPNNEFAFSPAYNFDTDAFYTNMKQKGVRAHPCLQLNPEYLRYGRNPNAKPIAQGADSYDPASYIEHADYLFQFAARYGSQSVSTNLLKLRSDQQALSGLDLINYIENWNEPDKWWLGKEAYFDPFEMAAMCSADYDGHEGTLGNTVGVKNADSQMKLVLGGLTAIDLHYIRGMKAWSDMHRSSFPVDVLNFHHYSNDAGGQRNSAATVGISPEADSLKQRLQEVVAYRDRYLPGVEIWLSEFGYSTHPNSVQRAPAIGPHDTYEMQSRWLVRSFLEIAAAGVDRSFQFALDDPNSSLDGAFSTAGLTKDPFPSGDPAYEKKPSWFYVSGFKNALTGYHFERELPSDQSDVNIYEFVSDSLSSSIIAVWCNTSNNTQYPAYSLDLSHSDSAVTLITLLSDSAYALESAVACMGDSVIISISEMPVFVRMGTEENMTPQIPTPSDSLSLADQAITLYLDENGQATLDNESLGLYASLPKGYSLSLQQSTFDCGDEGGPLELNIYSDNSWTRSGYTELSQGFPWVGASQLPDASTFNQTVEIGQPFSWNSLDVVSGSDPIKASNDVRFYRKTFNLSSPQGKTLEFSATMDDDMEIYINGHLIAREGSFNGDNSKFPAHKLTLSNSIANGVGGQTFDYTASVTAESVLIAGENEIILAIRNGGGGNKGAFSFHCKVSGNDALSVEAILSMPSGSADTANISISLLDTLPFTIAANDVDVFLGNQNYSIITVNDVDAGSFDNCSPIVQRIISIDSVSCSDLSPGGGGSSDSVVIISDDSWVRSYVTASYSYPFDNISINLPSAATYNQPTNLGQPYHWHRVDQIPGTDMIRTNPGISFYRKTFNVTDPSGVDAVFEAILDDYIRVYINGTEIFGTNEPNNWAGGHQFPAYRLEYTDLMNPVNGLSGNLARSFGRLYSSDLSNILQSGTNEIVLVAGNKNDASNFGGISFRMTLTGDASSSAPAFDSVAEVPGVFTVINADGDSLTQSFTVNLYDDLGICSSAKNGQKGSNTVEEDIWFAQVYPNPSNGNSVHFECPHVSADQGQIKITDYQGRIVEIINISGTNDYLSLVINTSSWSQGLYILEYSDYSNRQVNRLLVQ